MADAKEPLKAGKGKAFFDRADQMASTGNWDYAIDMYLEGISREPDNIERGHQPLREVSMKRKAQGGKGPSMMETFKLGAGKDQIVNLRNAEYLLAKEPGSVQYMERVMTAAQKLSESGEHEGSQMKAVVKWICDLMITVPKLDKRVLLSLAKGFDAIEEYRPAVTAVRRALELSPNDENLKDALRELEARAAIKAGQYGSEGGFEKGVKNFEKQQELLEKDKFQQGRGYLESQIERCRKEYESTPTVAGKINAYVDALMKIEEETFENQAIDVLKKAFIDTKAYQFKLRIGDIHIRQGKRRYAKLMAAGDREGAMKQAKQQLEMELAEYADRALNYPTDLAIKYELGRRQFLSGQLDDAIASLQQAQRDPRRHVTAMLMLGQAFSRKGWLPEALETYEKVLGVEMTEDRRKETLYNLADACEKLGDANQSAEMFKKAQEYLSQLAQVDYNYKDVRKRLEDIRSKTQRSEGA